MPRFPTAHVLAIAVLVAAGAACSGGAQEPGPRPAATSASQPRPAGALPRLVFFMNPNGGPCQLQDRILRDMSSELFSRAELVYYRTTEPGDLPRFSEYGIRALPTLLVTDATGRELRRATPGIQGPEQIRALLQP